MDIKFSAPTGGYVEPITLDEAKNFLKVDFSDDDDLIKDLITGVREESERYTGRSFVAKTIDISDVDVKSILLPYPDHNEILKVEVNGVDYPNYTKTGLTQFRITFPDFSFGRGFSFGPQILSDGGASGEVHIQYSTTNFCPTGVKNEMLKAISERYNVRSNTVDSKIRELSETSYANLAFYCLE